MSFCDGLVRISTMYELNCVGARAGPCGAPFNISGLAHLEGQTVSVLADGATHPDKVVSSGAIVLERAASKVKVGLPYTSLLQTMRIKTIKYNIIIIDE